MAYCVLSFLSFQKVMRIYNHDNNGIQEIGTLWATLCATFIGPFTVVAFFALGTALLLKKTVSESGLTYSYGALHWSSLWMAVVVLQSAVSLQGQKGTMEDIWEKPSEHCLTYSVLSWLFSATMFVVLLCALTSVTTPHQAHPHGFFPLSFSNKNIKVGQYLTS